MEMEADSVVGQEEREKKMAKTSTTLLETSPSLLETSPTRLTDLPDNILRCIFQVEFLLFSRCSGISRFLVKFPRVGELVGAGCFLPQAAGTGAGF